LKTRRPLAQNQRREDTYRSLRRCGEGVSADGGNQLNRNLSHRLRRLETRAGIEENKPEPHVLVFIDPQQGETCRYLMETKQWVWRICAACNFAMAGRIGDPAAINVMSSPRRVPE
jgi:hypothetical protein